jgi:hypothetical protein
MSVCRFLALAAILGGCAAPPPPAPAPEAPAKPEPAPVVRETVKVPLPKDAAAEPLPVNLATMPPNTLYVCTKKVQGQLEQTRIEFNPARVEDLCRRHPEMGPCQYERDMCRRNGGRVFTAEGKEITLDTEAEYDKKVYRVRFRAD